MASARVGGNWNNGANDGPSYWNCNNRPSNSNINYRARHSYREITTNYVSMVHSLPLGKNCCYGDGW